MKMEQRCKRLEELYDAFNAKLYVYAETHRILDPKFDDRKNEPWKVYWARVEPLGKASNAALVALGAACVEFVEQKDAVLGLPMIRVDRLIRNETLVDGFIMPLCLARKLPALFKACVQRLAKPDAPHGWWDAWLLRCCDAGADWAIDILTSLTTYEQKMLETFLQRRPKKAVTA